MAPRVGLKKRRMVIYSVSLVVFATIVFRQYLPYTRPEVERRATDVAIDDHQDIEPSTALPTSTPTAMPTTLRTATPTPTPTATPTPTEKTEKAELGPARPFKVSEKHQGDYHPEIDNIGRAKEASISTGTPPPPSPGRRGVSKEALEAAKTIMESMPMERRVGQLLIAVTGIHEVAIENLIAKGVLGGVFVMRDEAAGLENRPNKLDEAQGRLQSFQSAARRAEGGKIPLFIASDDEGGSMINHKEITTPWPSLASVGSCGTLQCASTYGETYGAEMRNMGYNMVFAPVLDVNTNPDNPVINVRSLGSDPQKVAQLGVALVKGYMRAGIVPVAKHFPGHGDTAIDSHFGSPMLQHSRDRFESIDLLPFKAAIQEANIPAVMSAHITVPALDKGDAAKPPPATLSKKIMTEILRDELHFAGLVISDSMAMGAIADHYPRKEAWTRAVMAGVDMILDTSSDDIEVHFKGFVEAVKANPILQNRTNQACLNILGHKIQYGLIPTPGITPAPPRDVSKIAEREASFVADRSVALRDGRTNKLETVLQTIENGPLHVFYNPDARGVFEAFTKDGNHARFC